MDDRPYYVISDIHLGAVPDGTEALFRQFLEHVARDASGLLINGDLFDFWFEYRTVIPRRHYRVLAALADIVEAGVPVTYVGGNHDAWGGGFLRDEVGVEFVDGPVELQLCGRRALVAHGDGVGPGDLGYRVLRRFIRNPLVVGAFRMIHPDWGARVAGLASTTHRKAGEGLVMGEGRSGVVLGWAEQRLRENPALDLVIAGHIHVPTVTELLPRRYYVNAGDWINHNSYVVLSPAGGAPELRTWHGPAPAA